MRKEFEQQRRQEEIKRTKMTILLVAAGLIAAVGIYIGVSKLMANKVDASKGKAALEQLEKLDIASIEAKIEALEQADREADEAYANRTPRERFAGSLVMGDSITQGLTEYDILDASCVIADRGMSLESVAEEMEKAVDLHPKNIFLSYGMNDIKATNGDAAYFKKEYKAVLEEMKAKLPDTVFYINSILPVQQIQIDREPVYAHLPEYNAALQELCAEENIRYVDNTGLVSAELYEGDGIHMKPAYYSLWIENMVEVAGL